ncbi:MAG: hypothetical protein ACE14P_13145 [Methanotrichaceae archaeon]
MSEGIIQFTVEIKSLTEIRSRVTWPELTGPWIEGGLEDLMVHFMYAGLNACNMECAMSLLLTSREERLGQIVVDMISKMVETMGAVQVAEIRLTRAALDQLKRDRIEP